MKARWTLPGVAILLVFTSSFAATNYTVVGWNNLGMHCLDSDFSVFSILPPYNTIQGQVIQIINGNTASLLTVTNGFRLTYEAVADPDGSYNSTSAGKGNFWDNCPSIFGATLPMDVGLPVPGPDPFSMPGTNNVPQRMGWESAMNWFIAYGIPIMPADDTGKANQYPMMRLRLRNNAGTTLDTTDIVLPVSDEMDCKLCHLSGSGNAAKPAGGWVFNASPGIDYRLNILRLHDERQFASHASLYSAALTSNGFNAAGLFATVTVSKHPFICASCHKSEALPIPQLLGIPPLTTAMHGRHAGVIDPRNSQTLDAANNRTACYTCHPGSTTRCLRGAMGKAVAADGSMAMQCQSCHGNMSAVGSPARTGWLDEPNCQACHVGTATNSYGVIRFTDAFVAGNLRPPAEQTFATNPNTPGTGLSLYRFSKGHGGLQCSACHGSTHAEFPSAFANDNIQSQSTQGHAGMMIECESCHGVAPANNQFRNGPHSMHPMTSSWAQNHPDIASGNRAACQVCHGTDYRGTVLSRVQKDGRTVTTEKFGTKTFWRGQQISCYICHDGAFSSNPTTRGFPTANNTSATTPAGISVAIPLTASSSSLRIVSQPAHGTVALTGTTATYYPEPGYAGSDRFTFAANNGYNDSNLATVSIQVTAPDANVNNIPDWWETLHFSGPVSATADPDSDGRNNLAEFNADTDPLDARYSLRTFDVSRQTNDVNLSFTSRLTLKYALETATELAPANWSFAKVVWGRTDSTPVTDAGALSSARRFYRLRTSARPLAYDDASQSGYAAGFNNGSNGGTGFDAWQLSSSGTSGFFIGDSTQNGCVNDGLGNCPPCGPGINVFNTAFGMWANSSATARAIRPFHAGAMSPGQYLSLDFDNGCLDGTGTRAGFALETSSGEARFEFFFNAGDTVYRIHDASGTSVSTGVGFTQRGLHVVFTLTGPNSYNLTITRLMDGTYTTINGTLAGTANAGLTRLDLSYFSAGPAGSTRDVFFDRLELY